MTLRELLICKDPVLFQVWCFYEWGVFVPEDIANNIVHWGKLREEETEGDRTIRIKCWLMWCGCFKLEEREWEPEELYGYPRLLTTLHTGFVGVWSTPEQLNRLKGERERQREYNSTARSRVGRTEHYISPIDRTAARVTDFLIGEVE